MLFLNRFECIDMFSNCFRSCLPSQSGIDVNVWFYIGVGILITFFIGIMCVIQIQKRKLRVKEEYVMQKVKLSYGGLAGRVEQQEGLHHNVYGPNVQDTSN